MVAPWPGHARTPRILRERQPPVPPMKASDEPEIEPLQFVVRENAHGEQILDVVEGSFEQSYRIAACTRRSCSWTCAAAKGCCRTGIGASTPARSACAHHCASTMRCGRSSSR